MLKLRRNKTFLDLGSISSLIRNKYEHLRNVKSRHNKIRVEYKSLLILFMENWLSDAQPILWTQNKKYL